MQRGSSTSITMPLSRFLHRRSSTSIAAILYRGSSISITTPLGNSCSRSLLPKRCEIRIGRSAGRAPINIARFAIARFALNCIQNPLQAHIGRSDRSTWLLATGARIPPYCNCPARILSAAGRGRSSEDSNQAKKESSSVKYTPRACANETVALEAGPDYLPKADADVRLRAVDHTHRRGLAVFEALRGLTEPTGLSGLRSGI